MARELEDLYDTREQAQAEASRLNNARTSTAFSYGVNPHYDWNNGGEVIGYYVAMYSDD